ncbi:MAG TPA: ferredoxin [Mycobacteriales bacterium]
MPIRTGQLAVSAMPVRVQVNPIACEGRGMCAELLSELVGLDEWGYPLVDQRPVPPDLERHARRAVAACPTLALRLVPVHQR